MNKKIYYFLSAIIFLLFLFHINTNSKIGSLHQEVLNQKNNIQNLERKLEQMDVQINSITQNVENALEEQQKIIAEKSHTTIAYDKDTKTANMRIAITFKELEKNSSVLLKTEKGAGISTTPMSNTKGLDYFADIQAGLEEKIKLSAVCDGTLVKEEYLFDIDLKELLENRIRMGSGGSGTSYSPKDKKTSYNRDFEIVNEHKGDESLQINYCQVELKANDKSIFNETYDSYENKIYSDEFSDHIKVVLGSGNSLLEFDSEEDTHVSLFIKIVDNLGLTYQYQENQTILARDSADKNSGGGVKYEEKSNTPGYAGFKLVQ